VGDPRWTSPPRRGPQGDTVGMVSREYRMCVSGAPSLEPRARAPQPQPAASFSFSARSSASSSSLQRPQRHLMSRAGARRAARLQPRASTRCAVVLWLILSELTLFFLFSVVVVVGFGCVSVRLCVLLVCAFTVSQRFFRTHSSAFRALSSAFDSWPFAKSVI